MRSSWLRFIVLLSVAVVLAMAAARPCRAQTSPASTRPTPSTRPPPQTKPAEPPKPAKLPKEAVDLHVKWLVDGQYCPAIVVGIIDSTGTHVYGYGKTNLETGKEPDGDTIFEIGSVSKVFTATVLAQMLEQKQIQLNQTVDSILTDMKIPADFGSKIWLSHLVTHTSGLPAHPNNLNSPRPENPYLGYTQRQFADYLAGVVLSRAPGDKYEYSHVGYALLGQALAKKDGKSYQQMIKDRICGPLKMTDTIPTIPDALLPRLAHGYTVDGDKVELWENPVVDGAMGLKSTANDLLKFAAAHVGATTTPFAGALRLMQERQVDIDRQNDMGYGWQIGRRLNILWHNGETGGYHAFLACLPREKAAVVVLANSAYGAVDVLAINLVRTMLGESGGAAPMVMKIPVKVEPALLDRYVGDYLAGQQTLSVTRDGDHLYIAAQGQKKLKLYAENERSFFGKAINRGVEFTSDPNTGKQLLVFIQPGGPAGVIRVPAQKME